MVPQLTLCTKERHQCDLLWVQGPALRALITICQCGHTSYHIVRLCHDTLPYWYIVSPHSTFPPLDTSLSQWLAHQKTCPQCRERCLPRNVIKLFIDVNDRSTLSADLNTLDSKELKVRVTCVLHGLALGFTAV